MSEGPLYDPDALASVPEVDKQRLLDKIAWLWANRRDVTHTPLRSNLSGLFRWRVGAYRIIYTYDDNPDEMVIRLVGTRDEIYKEAPKKLGRD